ncbi:MAG: carbon-nitrogen hydrolase family protein [Deltaproteobacteria bacterium]|nr:MAG: carbon-nitrogen hydrolase family protein [Deltaproteobacteria bacterium]
MKVAAVQYKPRKGHKPAALEALAAHAHAAGARGAELIVLPEMAATGYVFASRAELDPVAEEARGETLAALAPVAREHGAWIVAGFPERAADKRFNSALVIDPTGALAFVYRKTLLYELDETWCDPGDSGYRAFDADFGRFTLGICMDLNDDRFTAWCAGSGARIIAFPTNWVDEDHRVWGYWAWRIDGTGAALVAANTWGREGTARFRGESAIIDGRVLHAAAPRQGDGVIVADLKEPVELAEP